MDEDFEITPEEEAEIIRSMQDADAGYFYTMLYGEDGNLSRDLQCNKCKRVAAFGDFPFPHKFDCPMKR